jgi:multicomponent Na+:H+ antiporter subunit A
MAGIPPLLGFPTKEAAVEAALGLSGAEFWIVGGLIIGGSVLTVAYTTRLLIGMFGASEPMPDREVAPRRPAMSAPESILAAASLLGFVTLGWVTGVVRPAVITIDPKAEVYSLLRWPGLTDAFITSLVIVAFGLLIGALLARRHVLSGPAARGAANVDWLIDGVGRLARQIAGRVQHGSLPLYLATTVLVVCIAAVPFVGEIDPDTLYWWDNLAEAVLVLMIVAAAISATLVSSRLGAALVLGAVGFSVAGLFVAYGAPDLVLTQLLVETVIVVGFVVGLGRLATKFPTPTRLWLTGRLVIAGAMGSAVAVALAGSAGNPVGTAPVRELAVTAQTDGGGKNVVNVILTDTRALDTFGEVIVLMVVAVGILTLSTKRGRIRPTASKAASPSDPSPAPDSLVADVDEVAR